MQAASEIRLMYRLAVSLAVWILAALVAASFSHLMLEYDGPHTEFHARLAIFLFSPLELPHALAWSLIPTRSDVLPTHEFWEFLGTIFFLGVLLFQTWFTVTRKTLIAFTISSSVQALILAASSICVLRYWDWDYHHMHG